MTSPYVYHIYTNPLLRSPPPWNKIGRRPSMFVLQTITTAIGYSYIAEESLEFVWETNVTISDGWFDAGNKITP